MKKAANEITARVSASYETPRSANRHSSQALAWVMFFYVVVAVGRIESLFRPLNSLHLAKIVAAVAIITALRHKDSLAPTRLLSVRPAKLLLMLMGLITISIFFSVLRSGTLGVIEGTVLSVTIAAVLIVKAAKSWEDTRILLLGCVGSAVVLGLAAMETSLRGRAGDTSAYDPNDFAFVLVTLLPVVVTFAVMSRGVAKIGFFGVAAWIVLTILRTQSRGGLLGLLFVTLTMAILLPKNRRGLVEFTPTLRRTLGRLLLVIILGAAVWTALPQPARIRLATITSLGNDYNANLSGRGRLTIWVQTLPLILRRPWGYGAGAFTTVNGLFAGGRYRAPHNMFLQALIELGVEGFFLFLVILISAFRMLGRSAATGPPTLIDRSTLERTAFSRALMTGLLGGCVSGFFLSELYSQVLWILIVFACVVGRPAADPSAYPARAHRPARERIWARSS